MTSWFNFPVTHGYITSYEGPNTDTPHWAEDIGTPFHTPITAILPGTVKVADYQGWGGEIFIQPDDKNYPEYYFYHPDRLEVSPGQHVQAGQEIALSGGENPGYPGAEHPAAPQWSSGPHTHVGWFTRWASTPIGTRPYGPDPSNLLSMAKGTGGTGAPSNVPQSVYNAVEPIAQQYGVPDAVWEDVAYVESGFNTQAIGDQGTSFGIFQLHKGGQLPSQYDANPSAVYDPKLNAQIAMPSISNAWKSLSGSFSPTSQSWWQSFAAQSGHPGGSPGQSVTDAEAAKLQSDYQMFSGNSSATPLSYQTGNSTCQAPTGINAINPGAWIGYWACQQAQGAANSASAGIAAWISSTFGPVVIRLGVGVLGIALVVIGTKEIVDALKNEPTSGNKETTEKKETRKKTEKKTEKKERKEEKKKEKSEDKSEKKEEKKPEPESKKEPEEPAGNSEGGAAEGAEAGGGAEAAAAAA